MTTNGLDLPSLDPTSDQTDRARDAVRHRLRTRSRRQAIVGAVAAGLVVSSGVLVLRDAPSDDRTPVATNGATTSVASTSSGSAQEQLDGGCGTGTVRGPSSDLGVEIAIVGEQPLVVPMKNGRSVRHARITNDSNREVALALPGGPVVDVVALNDAGAIDSRADAGLLSPGSVTIPAGESIDLDLSIGSIACDGDSELPPGKYQMVPVLRVVVEGDNGAQLVSGDPVSVSVN